ncbi:unnamed protein product [Strongylus vulgaris]|uniref:Uncharacterized protein n=1 Tax=Strongylus vulgaris TaxID=40348 RepID=A0A3P7KHM2_STRVU|nr:unnamed protein product [Strongylus vulgaris]
MKRIYKWGVPGAIVAVLIIVGVVLAIVLTGKKEQEEVPVMYFAIHLGDAWMSRMPALSQKDCSLAIVRLR